MSEQEQNVANISELTAEEVNFSIIFCDYCLKNI